MIVFSDGLDIDRCVALKKASDLAGVGCSFGVGTFFTNGEFGFLQKSERSLILILLRYLQIIVDQPIPLPKKFLERASLTAWKSKVQP